MPFDCIGVGIIAFDHLIFLSKFPKPDSKTKTENYFRHIGGPVPVAMATLARLGKSTALIAKMGADANGLFLSQKLQEMNVSTELLLRSDQCQTAEAFCLIDKKNGSRTVLLHLDNKCDIAPDELPLTELEKTRIMHIDGHDSEADIKAAKLAKVHRIKISIDMGSNRRIPKALLALIDYAVVSEEFANTQLVRNSPEKSVQRLLESGIQIAGVTCGPKGSFWGNENEILFQRAFRVNTINSTGAGDAYHGAFLYGILENFSMKNIALFSSAVAAFKCSAANEFNGIPSLKEIELFLEKNTVSTQFLKGGKLDETSIGF